MQSHVRAHMWKMKRIAHKQCGTHVCIPTSLGVLGCLTSCTFHILCLRRAGVGGGARARRRCKRCGGGSQEGAGRPGAAHPQGAPGGRCAARARGRPGVAPGPAACGRPGAPKLGAGMQLPYLLACCKIPKLQEPAAKASCKHPIKRKNMHHPLYFSKEHGLS